MCNDLFSMDLKIQDSYILKQNLGQKIIKRLLDIVISVPLLIIFFPIILFFCILIRLESKGNPIYKQTRFGYKGTYFTVYKLRTMYSHSSDGNLSAPKDGDVRVTKVGKILRKTSLDEIPQLLNVIKGDMSIIGPRAVPEKELDLRIGQMLINHPEKEEFFKQAMHIRMLAKPGISGMAQAYGRSSLTVEEATGYDVYYAMNYSLGLDVKILFKTIDTVLFQRGVN
ncbi:sugar transferase [Clostridiaceae bacterium]|nr:sugar transferase [Clostridiaceae bacterium]RKI17430.1 sugar transferase [bacterium 1XD21-70]